MKGIKCRIKKLSQNTLQTPMLTANINFEQRIETLISKNTNLTSEIAELKNNMQIMNGKLNTIVNALNNLQLSNNK